jgi:K+-sensing histidine kinase KdpD
MGVLNLFENIELVITIVTAVAVTASTAVSFFMLRARRQIEYQMEESRFLLSRLAANTLDDIDDIPSRRAISLQPSSKHLYENLLAELEYFRRDNARLDAVASASRAELDEIRAHLAAKPFTREETELPQGGSQLARDINHALKTPLSRLDATSSLLESGSIDSGQAANRIRSATQISYYYLNAFRSLFFERFPGTQTENLDFERSVIEATTLYISGSEKYLEAEVRLPSNITAIADYYAIATLMPLIENAVQAAPEHSVIAITGDEIDGLLTMKVQNEFIVPPPGNFEKRGVTGALTDTSEGLGIDIARGFLTPLQTGEMQFAVDRANKRVAVTLKMRSK